MNRSFRWIHLPAIAAACLAAVGISLNVASAQDEPTSEPHPQHHKQAGMQHMQGCPMHQKDREMTGDADHDFAAMMRRHHEMGLHMAQRQLKIGKDPQLRALAQKIVDEQKQDIAQLDAWLAKSAAGKKAQ